ncbi:DNA polymerase [Candidatus Pelagibacter sp.]|nr:DNA polymerase [Candidatus Pelagibacter sp.]
MKPVFKPQTEWLPPESFPDLSKYDEIAIDLETKDPDLKSTGSGAIVGNGKVVGVAVAVEGWSGYYPIAHEGGGNMDIKMVLNWFTDVLKTPAIKIFHNAMYDVCWIRSMGLKIEGKIVDTMIAGSLVDENRFRYDLGSLGRDYVGIGKSEAVLKETAAHWGIDHKAEMYKLPAMYVGEYAEQDAVVTLKLWQEMKRQMENEDVQSIFDLETELFPCLVDMRFLGVRVDVEAAHKLKQELVKEEQRYLLSIKKETGIDVQIWAARSIEQIFKNKKLDYPVTAKTGAPSFTKNFLQNHPNPVVQQIAHAREINKSHTTFIDTILKHSHKGRIHAEINQIRSDQGGTVTGRFSYNNPNLQQIPARNKELGPRIRSLFIPEEGCTWGCFDYSQQEPRLVTHYASMDKNSKNITAEGLEDVLEAYLQHDADFHKIVAEMANIPRSQAKTINLGLFYGMGKNKLQAELGLDKADAEELFQKYHSRVPFVKQLTYSVMERAQDSGRIRTLLGRRCRFNLWEPRQFGVHKALPKEEAEREHGPGMIKRAYTYKALNKLIQGSAADMTKKAMVDLYKEGIIPHIQVHDELDISVDGNADKIKEIMESAVELEVPNKVDYESGPNWGAIK